MWEPALCLNQILTSQLRLGPPSNHSFLRKMPEFFLAFWSCFKSNVGWKRTELPCFFFPSYDSLNTHIVAFCVWLFFGGGGATFIINIAPKFGTTIPELKQRHIKWNYPQELDRDRHDILYSFHLPKTTLNRTASYRSSYQISIVFRYIYIDFTFIDLIIWAKIAVSMATDKWNGDEINLCRCGFWWNSFICNDLVN